MWTSSAASTAAWASKPIVVLARRARKRAPLGGALFAFWLLVGIAQACDLATPDDRVRVRHVHDGDSLVLEDGRRLRVMGINAPELGRDGSADEPFAIAARDALRRELFRSGQVVGLRYGVERQDHYGRTLAHIFSADGENLGAALLRQGLAMAIVIPPDLWGLDCYPDAEREAREAGRGLWAHPDFQPRESRSLGMRDEGFMLVRGRVQRIGRSRDARWINLEVAWRCGSPWRAWGISQHHWSPWSASASRPAAGSSCSATSCVPLSIIPPPCNASIPRPATRNRGPRRMPGYRKRAGANLPRGTGSGSREVMP